MPEGVLYQPQNQWVPPPNNNVPEWHRLARGPLKWVALGLAVLVFMAYARCRAGQQDAECEATFAHARELITQGAAPEARRVLDGTKDLCWNQRSTRDALSKEIDRAEGKPDPSAARPSSASTTNAATAPIQTNEGATTTPAPNAAPVTKADADAMMAELAALSAIADQIEPMRRGLPSGTSQGDLETVKSCVPFWKDATPRAKTLGARSESLPDPLKGDVGIAAFDLQMCVICDASASTEQSCHDAKDYISAAKKDFPKTVFAR